MSRRNDKFLQGYCACLANISAVERIDTLHFEAFGYIGSPSDAELEKAGVSEFDREQINRVREQMG